MNQIVASRRAQSAELPEHDGPQPARAGVWTIVNAWPTRSLNSATWALTQIISPIRPNTSRSRTISPTRSCSKSQRKSKLGREGSASKLGKTPCVSAQAKSDDCARDVDDREHGARADERRVGLALDRPVGHRQADDVAGAGGEDGVDADARDVGGVDRQPADARLGVGGREHVPPRAARAHRLRDVAADRDREGQRLHRREVVPERLYRIEDASARAPPYPVR